MQQVNKKRRQWAPLCGGQPGDALLTELLGKPLKLEMNLIVFHSCTVTHRIAVQNLVSCFLIDRYLGGFIFFIFILKDFFIGLKGAFLVAQMVKNLPAMQET